MSLGTKKRFWDSAAPVEVPEGWAVALDGRRLKTPAKDELIAPTLPMAAAIAAEWDAQEDTIDPLSMPVTRSANAAIDKVRHQHREVAEMLAAYGDSDLLCYRAEAPQALVARQAELWNPALDWAHDTLGARLQPRTGVMHAPQDPETLAQLAAPVHCLGDFQLAAFHDLVSLSGSLVLAFGAVHDWRDADDIWTLSRLDEIWQATLWGQDDEADAHAETKRQAFLHAKRFFDFS